MAESSSLPGIDLPSPILSARLRELAGFLAAPSAGRLTDEQRALSLGVARRVVADAATLLGLGADVAALWRDWVDAGVPGADRLAAACFARAEEHRWREQSSARPAVSPPARPQDAEDDPPAPVVERNTDGLDSAYLTLRIADRRRFDALGNPRIAIADLDNEALRTLLLDIAAWRLLRAGKDEALAAELGEAVRVAVEAHAAATGIDAASMAYHGALAAAGVLTGTASDAIARHDWVALTALAAVASGRRYADMALALLTAEAAALPTLLAPLRIDRAAIASVEASLALLSARAIDVPSPGEAR